jgi:hypothetical protein
MLRSIVALVCASNGTSYTPSTATDHSCGRARLSGGPRGPGEGSEVKMREPILRPTWATLEALCNSYATLV